MHFLSWSWPRRWWQWSVVVIVTLALAVVILLPRFLRKTIETQLARATTASVRVADVDLDFFRESLTVHEVIFTLPGEKQAVLAVKQLFGAIELSALLLRREVVMQEIRLVGVQVVAVRQSDGRLNLARLLPPSPPDAPPSDLPTLVIERVRFADVRVTYQDLIRAAEERLVLTFQELTANPVLLQAQGLAKPVSVHWEGALNNGALKGSAQVFWRRTQTQVDATVEMGRFSLDLVEPYLHDILTVQKIAGQTDARLRYQYKSNNTRTLVHALSGAATLKQITLTDSPAHPPMLQFPTGSVHIKTVDLLAREIHLTTIEFRNPQIFALQTEAGLNWTTVFSRRTDNAMPQPRPRDEESGWGYMIDEARIHDGEVLFRDDSWPETEMVKIVPTQLEVQRIHSDAQATPIRFQLGVGAGKIVGEGTLRFAPFQVDTRLSLSELWLAPLHPLLVHVAQVKQVDAALNGNLRVELRVDNKILHVGVSGTLDAAAFSATGLSIPESSIGWKQAHLAVSEGSTLLPALDLGVRGQVAGISLENFSQGDISIESVDGELRLTQKAPKDSSATLQVSGAEEAASEVSAQGRIGVTGFLVRQGPHNTEVLSCYQARAELAAGSRLVPLDLRFADVALEYPYVQGFRTEEGSFQLEKPSSVNAAQPPPPPIEDAVHPPAEQLIPTTTAAPADLPRIQIAHASLIGGQLYFEDYAVTPAQTIYWQDVRADLSDIGFPFARPTALTLHAYNMDGAPIEVKGDTKRSGDQLITHIQGSIDRMTLSRFNVYLAPLLGYQVRKGAVSVNWDLMLPGDLLKVNAAVTLHDLGLSGKQGASELETQVGLPMSLMIALLKDLNGNINLQVPVEGHLNAPGFRLEGTIWRAIRDVLIGAVTSPLKLLGSIFRRQGKIQDFVLDPIPFIPGTSLPSAAGQERLQRLKFFLLQRPELKVQLSAVSGPADQQVLQDRLLLTQLETTGQEPPVLTVPEAGQTAVEQKVSPEEEVKQFLVHSVNRTEGKSLLLSAQATALLKALREKTLVESQTLAQLSQERERIVITALTEHEGIAVERLQVVSEKLRGRGASEVHYMIQARENSAASVQAE